MQDHRNNLQLTTPIYNNHPRYILLYLQKKLHLKALQYYLRTLGILKCIHYFLNVIDIKQLFLNILNIILHENVRTITCLKNIKNQLYQTKTRK